MKLETELEEMSDAVDGNPIRAAFVIGLIWAAIALIAAIGFGFFGCSDAEPCPHTGATRCDDDAVWACTTANEWAEEQNCETVTTLDGMRADGACCDNLGYAYCAIECEVADGGQ